MGRRKIVIEPIGNGKLRKLTFLRRKLGLFKKARELSVLCKCHVAILLKDIRQDNHRNWTGEVAEKEATTLMEDGGDWEYWGTVDEVKAVSWLVTQGAISRARPIRMSASMTDLMDDEAVDEEIPLEDILEHTYEHCTTAGHEQSSGSNRSDPLLFSSHWLYNGRLSRSWDHLCSKVLLQQHQQMQLGGDDGSTASSTEQLRAAALFADDPLIFPQDSEHYGIMRMD
jgi:hypothetical protein